MNSAFQFSLDAKVLNPEALYQAAMQKAQRIGRLSHDEAQNLFKPDGKTISIPACLVEIPGCEIQNSDATHVSNEGLEYSMARIDVPVLDLKRCACGVRKGVHCWTCNPSVDDQSPAP